MEIWRSFAIFGFVKTHLIYIHYGRRIPVRELQVAGAL